MRKGLLLLFLTIALEVQGQNALNDAENFYRADEFSTAEEKFKSISSQSPNTITGFASDYDLGLSYAAQKQWEKSMAVFRELLEDQEYLPLRLRRDTQIGLIESLAYRILGAMKLPAELESAEDWLREARQVMRDLQETECLLQKSKGQSACIQKGHSEALQQWLNTIAAQLSQASIKAFFSPTSQTEAIWKIQMALMTFGDQMDNLQNLQNNQSLFKQYLDTYLSQDERYSVLLKSIDAPESLLKEYNNYIQALHQTDLSGAKKALQNATISIHTWAEKLSQGEKGSDLLLQLFADYQFALRNDLILNHSIDVILDSFKEFGTQSLRDQISTSEKFAYQAKAAIKKGKQLTARLFLEEGRFALYKLIFQKKLNKENPINVLTYSIAAQRHAIRLDRLWIGHPNEMDEEVLKLLHSAQKEATDLIAEFPDVALNEQKKNFTGSDKKPGACQHRPWDQVMPLLYQAWASADKAKGNNLAQLLQHQDETYRLLNETLAILEKPIPAGEDSCYVPPPKKGGGNEGKEPLKNIENIMQEIQQMQLNDKLEQKHNVIRVGDKPW